MWNRPGQVANTLGHGFWVSWNQFDQLQGVGWEAPKSTVWKSLMVSPGFGTRAFHAIKFSEVAYAVRQRFY